MPADATQTVLVNDNITEYYVDELKVCQAMPIVAPSGPYPGDAGRATAFVFYRLRLTWASGKVTYTEKSMAGTDYTPCIASFMTTVGPTWKWHFLTYLSTNSYETNITVSTST